MADPRGGGARGLIIFAFLLLGNLRIADCITITRSRTRIRTVLGIHLGATYSCVSIQNAAGYVNIIANEQGSHITPSWVAFTDNERLIGEAAKNQTAVNPERTIFDVKRLMGRKFDDEEVQRAMELVPYKIVSNESKPYIEVKINDRETKLFSPEEITALILYKMKRTSETFLNAKIKDAMIAVPAYFNDAQRQATKDAAVIARLNVVNIIDEPVAAAFAYDLHKERSKRNVLVFNLGGHTFDVSIVSIDIKSAEVLSTIVDSHLGGVDFDQRIIEYLINSIKNKYGKDISSNSTSVANLMREAERAKIALSSQDQVRVEIESFSETLRRSRFEEMNDDLFRKMVSHVGRAMEEAGFENKKELIDEIILVGGSSRIPKVGQLLRDYFGGKEPNIRVNPDEAVAYGAAIQGVILRQAKEPWGIFLMEPLTGKEDFDILDREFVEEDTWGPFVIPSYPNNDFHFVMYDLDFPISQEEIDTLRDNEIKERVDAPNRLQTYAKNPCNPIRKALCKRVPKEELSST